MPFYRLKHSFTAGELSPLMNDRVDFERYRNGCKVLRNMFCATQGPAIRRPGTKFVYDLNTLSIDTDDPQVRLIPFIFNETQAYALVFYKHIDGDIRLVFGATTSADVDGLVVGSGVACEYDFEVRQEYTGPDTYNFTLPAGLTYVDATGYHTAADDTETTLTEVASGPGADQFDVTYTAGTGATAIEVGTGSPATGGTVTFVLNFTAAIIGISEVVTLVLPSGWDIDNFDWAQSGDEMYIAQADLPPHIIKRHGHQCWSLHQVSFANQPSDWSDTYGWPRKVTFHQQRLALAGNALRRQTVWMSQAGDFLNFGVSATLADSDAVTFTLDSGTQNRIQWITTGKSLHVGTLGNEWTVTGNDQSALTPTNILAQRQTNNGSEQNTPLLVGLTTLFVERHGRTVNEFVYDYTFDSYKTSDMAILSPHLTESYSITDWTYQQTPDSIIWCVREDGTLLGVTYQRQHKVVGWHRHDTQGEFLAVTSVPGVTREDDVWFIVQRNIDTEDKFYLEKLEDWFKGGFSAAGKFLDSHLVYSGAAATEISGLAHLKNETVSILADGAAHADKVVASNGIVELDRACTSAVIGLAYESEVRPNLTDADVRDGTSRGRTQRITNIFIDLYNSVGMYVGRNDPEDGETEEEQPFRTPAHNLGEPVPLYTGWYKIAFLEGQDSEPEYFIRQKQPFPLTVRGIVDEVEVME